MGLDPYVMASNGILGLWLWVQGLNALHPYLGWMAW